MNDDLIDDTDSNNYKEQPARTPACVKAPERDASHVKK